MKDAKQLVEAIDEGDAMLVRSLIQGDSDLVNFRRFGEQPLHCAVRAGNQEIASALLAAGADINSPGSCDEFPLHCAVRIRKIEMVRLLLSHHPRLDIVDEFGISPLLLAARSGESEIADELLRHGAELDFHSAVALGRAEIVKSMLRQQPDIVQSVIHKNDLLPDAIYVGSVETVEVLLGTPGIDVHSYGLSGALPLIAAVSSSDAIPAIVKLLLRHGADPHRPGRRGDTAMDTAQRIGVQHLLE